MSNLRRRRFLIGALEAAGAAVLAGCDRLSQDGRVQKILGSAESINYRLHRLLAKNSLAQEYTPTDLSPHFRSNGTAYPQDEHYQMLATNGFAGYGLRVSGLVKEPQTFSLSQLRKFPSRTQITRHDCVEGWSAIGKWKGVNLSALLDRVRPLPDARYVVFYCADVMIEGSGKQYYESIDMDDARHPQTILAYELNDEPLPVANGAPIRVRVERQLGYKMAKYIMAIELVRSFEHIGGGKGGYWEDEGYDWYAGI